MAPNTINRNDSIAGTWLGMMIQTPNGKTIIIDGGMQHFVGNTTTLETGPGSGELANMKAWLQANAGNHVDVWIFTHPHNDHARVPAAIIHEGNIKIDKVYGVNFPKEKHDAQVGDETPAQSAFVYNAYDKVTRAGKYTEIRREMKFTLDGVTIEFLNEVNNLYRGK